MNTQFPPPTTEPATSLHVVPPHSNKATWIVLTIAALICAGIIGMFMLAMSANTPEAQQSSSALFGCRNLREVANDYSAGVLTRPELRSRMLSVRKDSEFAPPLVKSAADDAARAATAGDDAALAAAITSMNAACISYGQ